MRYVIVTFIFCLLAPINLWANDVQDSFTRPTYKVFRNGSPMGFYQFEKTTNGEREEVNVDMHLKLDILFFTAYEATHERSEQWVDDKLVSMESSAIYNGKPYDVKVDFNNDKYTIEINGETQTTSKQLVSFNPWAPEHWEPSFMITEKGKLRDIDRVFLGEEKISLNGKDQLANHYRITGDIERDVWYNKEGLMLLSQFEKKESAIRLELASPTEANQLAAIQKRNNTQRGSVN